MNFVVAFKGEALPLIDFYRMEKRVHSAHSVFQNEHHKLILSGPGRKNAISATETLFQMNDLKNQGWINVGVAGHGSLAVGESFLCGKVLDDSSAECFYPPQIFEHSFGVSSLTTCSKPSSNYQIDMGFDMEAHAFYKTASKFSIRELVQVIKIVSDNPDYDLNQVNPKGVPAMIERHLEEIDVLVKQIDTASLTMQSDDEVDKICEKIKSMHSFSVTHRHQLHDLLRQAKNLGVDLDEIEGIISKASIARDAMKEVTHFLEPKRILG